MLNERAEQTFCRQVLIFSPVAIHKQDAIALGGPGGLQAAGDGEFAGAAPMNGILILGFAQHARHLASAAHLSSLSDIFTNARPALH